MVRQRPQRRSLEAESGERPERALASTDFHTRQAAVKKLAFSLSTPTGHTRDGLLKLWKGLFYAFWHSDQAPVQRDLAQQLAELPADAPSEAVFLYFEAFILTMQREWFGIDKHRLDKFLMLVRVFLKQQFCWLSTDTRTGAEAGRWKRLLLMLLVNNNEPGAAGLAYHTADVLFEAATDAAGELPVPKPALKVLLDASCDAVLQSDKPLLQQRLRLGVFEKMAGCVHRAEGNAAALAHLDERLLAARLFDLGALPSTSAKSRKVLYSLSQLFTPSGALPAAQSAGTGLSAAARAADATAASRVQNGVLQPVADTQAAQPGAAVAKSARAAPSCPDDDRRKKRRKLTAGASSAPEVTVPSHVPLNDADMLPPSARRPIASAAAVTPPHHDDDSAGSAGARPRAAVAQTAVPDQQSTPSAAPLRSKRRKSDANSRHAPQASPQTSAMEGMLLRPAASAQAAAVAVSTERLPARAVTTGKKFKKLSGSKHAIQPLPPVQLPLPDQGRQPAASPALTPSTTAEASTSAAALPALRSALKRKSANAGAGTVVRGGHALRATPKSVHFALKRNTVLGQSASERPIALTQPRQKRTLQRSFSKGSQRRLSM